MSYRTCACILLAVLLACLWWQHRELAAHTAELGEVKAANAVLREQASALLRDMDAVNAALINRETAHETIDAQRTAERHTTAQTLREPANRAWGDSPLPAGVFSLLRPDATEPQPDGTSDASNSADGKNAGTNNN